MTDRTWRARRAAAIGILGSLLVAGCGATGATGTPEETGLAEFAAAYRHFVLKHGYGPSGVEGLRAGSQSYPNALQMARSGELVVRWGAPLAAAGQTPDAVLAYVKAAPALGGRVLMHDGRTIREMSAEEFNAAPKAAPAAPPRTRAPRRKAG
jgi:hypothetical protein